MELEIQSRDQQKVIDLQENQLGKQKEEIVTYRTMLEVRTKSSLLIEKLEDMCCVGSINNSFPKRRHACVKKSQHSKSFLELVQVELVSQG